MHLERKGDKSSVKNHESMKDIRVYLGRLIDLYSAASIKKDLWLTDTEKLFYIATLIHVNSGYLNPISGESVQIYKDYFSKNANKSTISDYINRLRTKRWIKYDKVTKIVEIPPFFKDLNLESGIFDFNIRLSYERDTTDRHDHGGDQG